MTIRLARVGKLCGLFGAGCVALCPIAFAAQPIEEIVVTVRKREEALADVPLSVAAFDARALRDRNINNAYDVATFTPNFNFGPNIIGRQLDAPNIRGQFSPLLGGSPAIGSSNVAFYVDGVFITGTSSTLPIENLERVEVLRGPQAAQFGRSAFAGAVNFVTRAPTNEFEGEINARMGEDADYNLGGFLSGPIIQDKLLFFVSGTYETWDGEWSNGLIPCEDRADDGQGCTWVTNNFFGTWPELPASATTPNFTDLGGEETWNVTGKIEWRPRDDFAVSFKASYTETNDDHYATFFQGETNCFLPGDPGSSPDSPGWFCGELKVDGLINQMNIADFGAGASSIYATVDPAPYVGAESETRRYLAEIFWDPGDWSVIARYAWNEQEVEQYRDLDRSPYLGPADIGVFTGGQKNDFEDQSFEFRVSSPQDERFRATAGLYYYDSQETAFQRDFTGICRFNFGDPRIGPGAVELYEGDPGYDTTRPSPVGDGDVTNEAVFGSVEYDLTPFLTASVEGRYAVDTPKRKSPRGVSEQDDFESFAPRYTLTYRPNDDLTLYGLAAKGTKPGGFFFAYFDVDVAPADTRAGIENGDALFDEEEAWTYEIGAKTSWLDGRLALNASLFYIDWTNQAINENVNIPTVCNGVSLDEPNRIVFNAGESRVYGLEMDLQLAATENLFLSLAYGLQDTKLEDFESLTYAELTGGDGDVSGNEAPRVPKHNVTAAATYTRSFNATLDWFARTDWVYESEQWISAVNEAKIGETYLWNARLGVENDSIVASVYVDNILDEDAPVLVSDFPNFQNFPAQVTNAFPLTPRRSRNWGVSLTYRFGGR
ncbi:MAG: TonB-dependent receptor [Chromatiales bacterium]|nr:MAG: TonB-dependent receptor [Chromatiales bacterium]